MLISPFSLIIMNEIEMNLCLKWRLVDTISTKTNKNLLAAIYGGLWCYFAIYGSHWCYFAESAWETSWSCVLVLLISIDDLTLLCNCFCKAYYKLFKMFIFFCSEKVYDMATWCFEKFIFECWKNNIVQHKNRNFVPLRDHVSFCFLYKHLWNTKPF